MKKTLSLLLSLAAMFSGTIAVSADAPSAAKSKPVTLTIPPSYSYVYNRFVEILDDEPYYYYLDEIEVVDEEIIMEPAVEKMVVENGIMAAPAEAIVEETVVEEVAVAPDNDYSKTNTQVEGIDEADIVKTDGKYIYVLKDNYPDKQLVILSANGKDSAVISKTNLGQKDYGVFYENEMYLTDKYAVLLTNRDFSGNHYLAAEMYDISDPASPKLMNTLGQEGYYNTSRMVGNTLYVLTNYSVSRYNLGSESDYDSYIPHLYKNGTVELISPKNIVLPPEITERTYTIITAYNLETGAIAGTKAMVIPVDTVYMSAENLYLADEVYYNDTLDQYTESVYTVTETVSGRRTTIYKMSLADPSNIVTKAVGTIDGTLLNQFAMDEYKGNLRVVTTHSSSSRKVYVDEKMGFTNTIWQDSQQTNGLYVFNETMDVVGSITGLAEDERVYSVRFTGDVGYFVTFRETDPLFAVDLSDAKNPKILSELKIPGFSEYLHPYADGLLFGLGQDADERRTNGVKLSMFDTSNPYDVTEKHKLLTEADYSTAGSNHKAVFVSAKHGLIGFPTEDGYSLFGYDAAKGFEPVANIGFTCSWRDSRAMYVGENLYIVTRDAAVVMDIGNHSILTTVKY